MRKAAGHEQDMRGRKYLLGKKNCIKSIWKYRIKLFFISESNNEILYRWAII